MYPNKQQLLDSIKPDMQLNKALFLKIYGYEISFPGFADEAIQILENSGCNRAREYYDMAVSEYQRKHDEELKPVARQIRKQWEKDWEKLVKEGDEKRIIHAEMELLEAKRQLLTQKSKILTNC